MQKLRIKLVSTAIAVLLLGTGCSDKNPEHILSSAKEYLQKNDTKAATIQIKNALQIDPNLGEARFLLGNILAKEGNASAAEMEYRRALTAKYPEDLVVPELARAMLAHGEAKKLVDEFSGTRFDPPKANASLQTSLAAAYRTLGKPDLAEAALSTALAADPNYAPALMLRAWQKAAAGEFDAALATLDGIISREPGNADAWKLKGDILQYGNNKPDDALAAYRKSIEVNAAFVPGQVAVLTTLLQQGKLDDATKQFAELNKLAPNSPLARYFEAQLAYQKKDYNHARDLSQQLLNNAPNDPRILQLAGAVELQMNSLVQAEIYLTRATQAAPNLLLARQLLVVTYLRSGQPSKALAALTAGVGKDGLDPRMFSLAGEVYLQNGDAATAEGYFAKALHLDPGNAQKRTALAITRMASGETTAAMDELQDIAGSDSGTTADLALISAHLRRKEYDQALAAVDRLEAKQPDKPLAPDLRGQIQLAQKDNAAARKSFERALTIDPSYFAAAASLATLDLADNKPGDAKQRFERLLAKNPKNGPALLALAQLAVRSGAGKDEVVGLLGKAVEADPNQVAPRLMLIDYFLGTNDPKRAETAAQGAVAAVPDSPDLRDALGRVQQASGELNQAIATFGKVAAMQPRSPVPHMRLAGVFVATKNYKAAEQSLQNALEIKPDFLEAQSALIDLYLVEKRNQDAVAIARAVQQQHPEAASGYGMEGDIHYRTKNWVAAISAYRAGLQKTSSPRLAIGLYSATRASGNTAEADRFAAGWQRAHPKDLPFLLFLGDASIARQDFAAAEQSYLVALQVQPDSPAVLNNLAWVTNRLHKGGALAYAEKANKLAPNQPTFMDTLAMVLSEKGEHAQAIDLQLKALELQPTNSGFRLNLAKIYLAAGDKARAKTELEVLAKLGDKDPQYSEATALLESL